MKKLTLLTILLLAGCSSIEAYRDMTPEQREEYKAEKREQIRDAKEKLDEAVKDYEILKGAIIEVKE